MRAQRSALRWKRPTTEFNRGHGQIDAAGMDATRATARLPGFDIEIVHRRPVED